MKSATVYTKKAIYYVFIAFDRRHLKVVPFNSQNILLNDLQNCQTTNRLKNSSFMTAILSLIARLYSCIVRGQFL